jgi:hypothetical protein
LQTDLSSPLSPETRFAPNSDEFAPILIDFDSNQTAFESNQTAFDRYYRAFISCAIFSIQFATNCDDISMTGRTCETAARVARR